MLPFFPPSFIPKVAITDLASYSCHSELQEGRAQSYGMAKVSLAQCLACSSFKHSFLG